ncbi:MAG: response regulator [Chloroflexota bacterium]
MAQPFAVIIEDQINLATLYEDALRLVGYNTVSIRNGLEALNYLQLNDVPNLVILDVNLPGMSGRDILRHIRSKEKYADLPVIILTANSLMVAQIRRETTALDYLFVKPITMPKLQELAKSMIRRETNTISQDMAVTQKIPEMDMPAISETTVAENKIPKTEPLSMPRPAQIETQETDILSSKPETQAHQSIQPTESEVETDQ